MAKAISYEVAFERVVGHEGNFQDHRADRGNWTGGKVGLGELKGTKFGISAMSYPHLDIKNLTVDQAKEIYRRDFWLRFSAHIFDAAIIYQLFDACVNHGAGNTARMLQRAVNVLDDGDIGKITKTAVTHMAISDVLMRFLSQRLKFMTRLSTFKDFGAGWSNRIALNLEYAAEDNEV